MMRLKIDVRTGSHWVVWMLMLSIVQGCETASSVETPGQHYFIKYYGGNGNQSGVDMMPVDDGVLLLGNWQTGPSSNRIYLVKTDLEGNVLWGKFHGSTTDVAKDIEPTKDGNFIILSDYQSAPGNIDIKLIKITPAGEKIDSVVYGLDENEIGKSVTSLADNGYIVTGTIEIDTANIPGSEEKNFSDIFHIRFGPGYVLDTDWNIEQGNGTVDRGIKLIQVSPTEFYAFGTTNTANSPSQGKSSLLYYGLNVLGNTNNSESYLGNIDKNTTASDVFEAPLVLGGGYFMVSTSTSTTDNQLHSLHVSKLRSSLQFDPVNDRQFDHSITIQGSIQVESVSGAPSVASTLGYLLLGNEVRANNNTNIWVTKINVSGGLEWSVSFGSEDENDNGAAIKELSDGRILVLGTMGFSNNQTKMALLKLNSRGQLLK